MHFQSGNSFLSLPVSTGGLRGVKQLSALIAVALTFALGCSRTPTTARLDSGLAEQIFLPKISVQENGKLNCQWVEFHHDSICGAGTTWNITTNKFDSSETYASIERKYVVCVPELQRWQFASQSTATFVAHSCIQECFIVMMDSTNKREAAWLAAPATQAYPLQVDSLFLILHESSTKHGLITVWLDRLGRELSRDTLNIPNPDFATATAGGVTFVKAIENSFHIYHLGRVCSWVDSGLVSRAFDSKTSIGTDYAVQDGELMIVSGYNNARNETMFETQFISGTRAVSTHESRVRPYSDLRVVACRIVATGEQFPLLAVLSESAEGLQMSLLAQDDEGYWSKQSSAVSPVDETIQEFCATQFDGKVFVAYTAATNNSATANCCRVIEFAL